MGVSLFRVAEQARVILEKRVSIQILLPAVIDAYGYVAKQEWYAVTQFDEQSIDGSFLNTFRDITPLYDADRDLYYIILPSTYLILPHEMGVNWISHMKDKTSWVRVQNWGMFNDLKASLMGSRQTYQIEGTRMLFPKMTKDESMCPILLKLAIAYDTIDPYEEINIGPNIINDIINIVTKPYMVKENPIEKIREIIN